MISLESRAAWPYFTISSGSPHRGLGVNVGQHVINLHLVLRLFVALEEVGPEPFDRVQVGLRAVVQLVKRPQLDIDGRLGASLRHASRA